MSRRLDGQAKNGYADAKFGAALQHGGAGALFFVERAVGGVEVAEVNVFAADFEDAVVARDFGIVEIDIGAVAAEDNARLGELVRGAFARAGDDCEDDAFVVGKLGGVVVVMDQGTGAGSVGAREGWQRRNDAGGFRAASVFDDGRAAALGAAELHFGVGTDIGILQHVFRAAVSASCLHGTKVTAESAWWRVT